MSDDEDFDDHVPGVFYEPDDALEGEETEGDLFVDRLLKDAV